MKPGAPGSFGAQLKALREAAGFTQEELATIAGLSVHAVSALERGERRRPHVDTVRALSAALDLTGAIATRSRQRRARAATRRRSTARRLAARGADGVCSAAMLTCRRCGIGSPIPLAASSRSPGRGARERPVWRWNSHARSRPRATRVVFVRWPPFATRRSSHRRSPRLSGCRMSPRATWRGARGLACTVSRRCSCSTISSRSWTRRRWSRSW